MNYKLFSALTFVAGAALGSVVTWKLVKNKYEQIAQEEIESVKEVYSNKKPSLDECVEEIIRQTDDKPNVMEYAAKIAELKYAGEVARGEVEPETEPDEQGEEEDSMRDDPYVITAEEYEDGEYDQETLTLFADGVLTDWYNDPIEDIDSVVGEYVIANFDDLVDGDTVYVRNDARETDYEIQRDLRAYSEVFPKSESTED